MIGSTRSDEGMSKFWIVVVVYQEWENDQSIVFINRYKYFLNNGILQQV